MHSYIETPTVHHLAPRATIEPVIPANDIIAGLLACDAWHGRAPFVIVRDYDGEVEVWRADQVTLGRRNR